MYVAGQWVGGPRSQPVINPYDGSVVDTVPLAGPDEVERALASAERGARVMRRLGGYQRSTILQKAARLLEQRAEQFAATITLEEGKTIREARAEVVRAVEVLALSAEEAKRLAGETVPLDGAPGVTQQFGFTIRVPCGIVVAISPFNFPLILVAHKVGPALAAGNSVILKPATDTPLSALRLVEVLLEAGLPAEAIQCVIGSGREIGEPLCADRRVRKITFTGSRDVGERICRVAGIKKVTMELGSNSPVVVMPDADLEEVAGAIAATGYSNAGQVCISAQRIIGLRPIYGDLIEALKPRVAAITTGDPLDEHTMMGPMVKESEAKRVEIWVQEAVAGGARLVLGGERQGAIFAPTAVADVSPRMRISCEELFGPAVALTPVDTIDEALALTNNSHYGLSAAIFTKNIEWAMRYAKEADAGNIHINWGPQWRADLMPYGGLKDSGFGKEGPRYAVAEMTELKMVVMHLK
ncbi:MAG: aldehyde dehydrogenase family protein [Armatimonadota bacterium]|nr:aldehyde dehydrogenase family protein [Armatimonadota bacterium]